MPPIDSAAGPRIGKTLRAESYSTGYVEAHIPLSRACHAARVLAL